MKLLVAMDGDGHFIIAHPTDRTAVLKLLESIEYGDYYNNIINDYNLHIKPDLSKYCCKAWDDIINHFIQRGVLEYVSVSDYVPMGCKCENSEQTLAL
jgi:hypothetical protein